MKALTIKHHKKTALLLQILIGLPILILLALTQPTQWATAAGPTPTPTAMESTASPDESSPGLCRLEPGANQSKPVPGSSNNPPAGLCRLELGANCDFKPPLDAASSISGPKTNPVVDARGVPTYAPISITFGQDMDFKTINNNTFYVSRGDVQLDGSVSYINASKMAVFYPDTPLTPDTTYTARVTTAVHNLSGQPLAQDIGWTFTTAPGISALSDGIAAAGIPVSDTGMNIYFGDLHSHSGYSDGAHTPADAFATARANGIAFLALTDHDIMLTDTEWQDILDQANAATVDGTFVGLRGFEFTHAKGHLNVFDTNTFIRGDNPDYANLENFYAWLIDQPTAIGQFNHPLQDNEHDWNFNGFAYNAAADQKIVLRELSNSAQFFLSLNAGWHVGTLLNSDTHHPNWGCCPPMGLVAPNLTKQAILAAIRARRTFFVSPSDRNFALVMQANGYWMGAAIPDTNIINFAITAHDPAPRGSSLRLAIYNNGVRVANTILPSASLYQWKPTIQGELGHYYYAEAYYNGWQYPAYSSPIWVERPPVAEAGVSQMVAPGTVVTLVGSSSWDPDGDALAYRWTQKSGTAVSLSEANLDQATFTAPGVLDDMVFRLTVTDTGSLSDSDTTTVTVTDKPILLITKSGPATTEPGELISYTLTTTNVGITDAEGIVITDAIPTGAAYVSGGTPMPGNIVSWTVSNLAANGGVTQTTFVVTATGGIANANYRASCPECVPAVGKVIVFTNMNKFYLPIIAKIH